MTESADQTVPDGYPDRSSALDALPGFRTPPPGYGEVPFWWWSGDDLDVERLLWQVRELHKKRISGFQVNYSHFDTPGLPTDCDTPALFSEAWWAVYWRVSEACGALGMGIGLSTYTIDWPKGADNLFYRLFYSQPELNALALVADPPTRLDAGDTCTVSCDGCFAIRAYAVKDGILQRGGIDLAEEAPRAEVRWTAPEGQWEVWAFRSVREDGSLNPLMPDAGDRVVQGFYQEFENHNPGQTSKGLNYFFNDELKIGLGTFAWNPDFPDAFAERKGYDLFEVLPSLWTEMGDITPKVRIDYADLRMSLMEERYFEPIFDWHASRGIIFGCDNHGRGLEPDAYGDYFRACRWYTAPGHDTPGGNADPIKGKVSSSIANLYQLPRVQLEGYHSLGWGATLEQMMFATRENYLYGCNLFSLHGFYYTTHGAHWEWAPPSYHFRMPYWDHMPAFLDYFERLSYLMSQGHHVCDVAVIYPVTPYEAGMNGDKARDAAFAVGRALLAAGINFDYIDHQSLADAEIDAGRLRVRRAHASYQALVVPDMEATRWRTMETAAAFAQAGGHVIAVGDMPGTSDRAGRNDTELAALCEQAFKPAYRLKDADAVVDVIGNAFDRDVCGLNGTVRAQHRKIGGRDVYMVMDAGPGDVVAFRARGAVELWDPWTGEVRALRVVSATESATSVELPLEAYEAQVVVFTPGQSHQNPVDTEVVPPTVTPLDDNWQVRFEPTMDNQFGDFRLPVTPENTMIGVEARRFAWARETDALVDTAMLPGCDDSAWRTQLHGYGPCFFVLGPVPEDLDPAAIDAEFALLDGVDPSVPVTIDGKAYAWQSYDISWRFGKEGDPGHQGFHGLKKRISENFIRLGKLRESYGGIQVLEPEVNTRYYLWTTAVVEAPTKARIHASETLAETPDRHSPLTGPSAVYINGVAVTDMGHIVSLKPGPNPVLIRLDDYGQSHFVLRREDTPPPEALEVLAMPWYRDAGVIPFDPYAGEAPAEWFRFRSAPGTTAILVQSESQGPVHAWLDGAPMHDAGEGRFEAGTSAGTSATVAVRLTPRAGHGGGAAIPEPITVETDGRGEMSLGDWSQIGILHNYSGGVRYTKTVTLTAQEASAETKLDLGNASATAAVTVNGTSCGVRVAPPWIFDVSDVVAAGDNTIEVLVFSTLANHYQTIPSCYRGDPAAGLYGPVTLRSTTRS